MPGLRGVERVEVVVGQRLKIGLQEIHLVHWQILPVKRQTQVLHPDSGEYVAEPGQSNLHVGVHGGESCLHRGCSHLVWFGGGKKQIKETLKNIFKLF